MSAEPQCAQMFDQTLFWACLWGRFWMRLHLNVRMSKADCPSPCWWASTNQLKAWIEQQQQKQNPSCLHLACTSVFSCLWTQTEMLAALGSWACWLFRLEFIPLVLLVSRLSDSRVEIQNKLSGSPSYLHFTPNYSEENII